MILTEKIKVTINSNIGEIITLEELKKLDPGNKTIPTYVYNIHKNNFMERVNRGAYKITKEINDLKFIRYPPNKLDKKPSSKLQKPILNKAAIKKHKELIDQDLYLDQYKSGKSMIENIFYSTYSHFNGDGTDSVCIPGPNIKRHIKNLVLNVVKTKGKIILVDADIQIIKAYYDLVMNGKFNSDLFSKISFYHGDIQDFPFYNVPFQDIDLMCTWESIIPLIKQRLTNQILDTKIKYNSFIFTVTETNQKSISYKSLSTLLSDILNIEITKVTKRRIPIDQHYCEVWENFVFDKQIGVRICKAFRYKSEAKPMFTFQIIYDVDEVRKKIL